MQKKIFTLLFIALAALSCTQFVKNFDDKYFEQIDIETRSEYVSIAFSHNINGETHPCGCRNNPLGGLPQVAGQVSALQNQAPTIYVDTGDALFPSPKVPDVVKASLRFTASKIAEAFDEIGLKYFTPGDQDFALGDNFLKMLAEKHKFKFLMTNASDKNTIKHKKWALHQIGENKILFLGITRPDLLLKEHQHFFLDPYEALQRTFKSLTKKYGSLSKFTIVLLSHSGLDYDKNLAKGFEQIDWIIGAHSQSYLRYTTDVGQTKIAQVLARNHYLGYIQLPSNTKAQAKYAILEMRDEKKSLIKNNPLVLWLIDYKKELEQIQLKEQEQVAGVDESAQAPIKTNISCVECHSSQTSFWQGTAHALAYVTLEKANSENNPSCIGCHSLAYQKIDGFTRTKDIVKVSKSDMQKYWNEWSLTYKKIKSSVRELPTKKRRQYAKKWQKLDQKYGVRHNYANVQCLNCHTQPKDHPFNMDEIPQSTTMQSKCVSCHTPDQSPQWYDKNNKGIATSLNKKYFAKQVKKVACPKL